MDKIIVVFLLLTMMFSLSTGVFAEKIDVKVNEVEEEKIEFPEENFDINFGGVKGNGGPVVSVIRLNIDELNEILAKENFAKFDEDLILFGFGGLGGSKKGSRCGFLGLEGKTIKNNDDTDELRKSVLNLNYGGFLYEKGVHQQKETNTDLALGAIMGSGNMELELFYDDPDSTMEGTITDPKSTNLKKEFVMIRPHLTLHQQIAGFVGLDLTLGYLLSYDFNENWISQEKVVNGPLDNFQAPTLDFKLSFGF